MTAAHAYCVPAIVLRTRHVSTRLIFTTASWGGGCHDPLFIAERTEAQGSQVTCVRSHSCSMAEWGSLVLCFCLASSKVTAGRIWERQWEKPCKYRSSGWPMCTLAQAQPAAKVICTNRLAPLAVVPALGLTSALWPLFAQSWGKQASLTADWSVWTHLCLSDTPQRAGQRKLGTGFWRSTGHPLSDLEG